MSDIHDPGDGGFAYDTFVSKTIPDLIKKSVKVAPRCMDFKEVPKFQEKIEKAIRSVSDGRIIQGIKFLVEDKCSGLGYLSFKSATVSEESFLDVVVTLEFLGASPINQQHYMKNKARIEAEKDSFAKFKKEFGSLVSKVMNVDTKDSSFEIAASRVHKKIHNKPGKQISVSMVQPESGPRVSVIPIIIGNTNLFAVIE